jgi:hypothetical protein
VMADLMGDHVSLRELAGLAADVAGSEPSLEILEERGVEVNLAIVRTVEWPHGGLSEPAGRARDAGKHHKGRRLVGLAVLRENLLPRASVLPSTADTNPPIWSEGAPVCRALEDSPGAG